jgi:hypothetical protein
VSIGLRTVRTLLESESLESVDVFVLVVFVTPSLVVILRDAPAEQKTAQITIGTDVMQLDTIQSTHECRVAVMSMLEDSPQSE